MRVESIGCIMMNVGWEENDRMDDERRKEMEVGEIELRLLENIGIEVWWLGVDEMMK